MTTKERLDTGCMHKDKYAHAYALKARKAFWEDRAEGMSAQMKKK